MSDKGWWHHPVTDLLKVIVGGVVVYYFTATVPKLRYDELMPSVRVPTGDRDYYVTDFNLVNAGRRELTNVTVSLDLPHGIWWTEGDRRVQGHNGNLQWVFDMPIGDEISWTAVTTEPIPPDKMDVRSDQVVGKQRDPDAPSTWDYFAIGLVVVLFAGFFRNIYKLGKEVGTDTQLSFSRYWSAIKTIVTGKWDYLDEDRVD